MKRIIYSTIIILCFSITSSTPQTPNASDYFPLQVGNTWIYDLYEWPDVLVLQDTISIIDSLSIENKTYFLFNEYFTSKLQLEDSVYLRVEADKVYRYKDDHEEVWFNFAAHEGDSWQSEIYIPLIDSLIFVKVTLHQQNYSFSINSRTFEKGYNFVFDLGPDHAWSYALAPQVGCVSSGIGAMLPRWYIFRSGTINGVYYPDLVTFVEAKDKLEYDSINQSMLSVYPNPFNSATKIIVNTLKAPGSIRQPLYIYDITGRRVKTFSINPVEASTIIWNGENNNGTIMPSGVYFVVLYFDKKYVTQKLLFVQ